MVRDFASPRSPALYFVFVTVLLDMLAFGMVMPVLPMLVQSFAGGSAERAAELFGLFGTAWAMMQFIFSPVLGSISDSFGRRKVILISCTGLGVDFALMALAPTVWWLLVGRVISGIAAANISTAGAYIADVTPSNKRAAPFGLIGAAFGIGFILGPALGGLLGAISPRLPFWAAAGLASVNVCWGLFVLPESLPVERRVPFSLKNASPLSSLKLLRSHPGLAGLSVSYLLISLAHAVLPSTAVLYMHYRYGWDLRTVGLVVAGVGLSSLIVQGILVGPIVRLLRERQALVMGLSCGIAGLLIYGLAPRGILFLVGIPIFALWDIAMPSLQSMMTPLVGASEQGRLQGALASLMGIANCIGPAVYTQVFTAFIGQLAAMAVPGAAFLLAALVVFVALMIAWRASRSSAIGVQA
jgi:DHA1 family tetracycline resistance protein-like MFS transporter